MSKIVFTQLITTIYARAFFVSEPDATPFMPGEVSFFPIYYTLGKPNATAFEIVWYANRQNADADMTRLTDTARLPSAVFSPPMPNLDAGPDDLQEGAVRLTRPNSAQPGDYTNPVGVLLMTQDTDTVKPQLYLTMNALEIPTSPFTTHSYKYAIGEPPIIRYYISWYQTQLDAKRMINRLTDIDRLPRAVFSPSVPNLNAGPDVLQDGTLYLYRPVSSMPYTNAVGLLCMEQESLLGKVKESPVGRFTVPRSRGACLQWEES
jgi:hypothetical protein